MLQSKSFQVKRVSTGYKNAKRVSRSIFYNFNTRNAFRVETHLDCNIYVSKA